MSASDASQSAPPDALPPNPSLPLGVPGSRPTVSRQALAVGGAAYAILLGGVVTDAVRSRFWWLAFVVGLTLLSQAMRIQVLKRGKHDLSQMLLFLIAGGLAFALYLHPFRVESAPFPKGLVMAYPFVLSFIYEYLDERSAR